MEIYRQTANIVSFEAPDTSTAVTVTASLNDGADVPLTITPETLNSKVKQAQLPYLPDEGTVKVNWTFQTTTFTGSESVTITDTYDVVTPILSSSEILAIHPQATPAEVDKVEKATRHIINAYTGQRFGRFVGKYEVSGDDSPALFLPARLRSLTSVNGAVDSNPFYVIDSGGYVLRRYPWGVPPVKADYYGLHMHTGGVIHNPNNVRWGRFIRGMTYTIDGVWGWDEVPSPVAEAAKLLVNDYACSDSQYRDRYLTSMTAADWRIQFNSGAFARTGNVRADQLLSEFVVTRGWGVI